MNTRQSFYDVKSFYNKKAKLKASFKGMRYQVEQSVDDENNQKLRACVWPEPFCYEKTPDKFKTTKDFEYSEQGLDLVYEWICTCYDSDINRWEHAMNFPLESAKQMEIDRKSVV